MKKYITYIRVSTKTQKDSGLGLEAQERDINLFLENYADKGYEVIAEFNETASGSNGDRVELNKAIKLAKKEKAILLVSRLDRLSRKVSFIATLMDDKKLQFTVASMPNADKIQLHLFAMMAEMERDFISLRTKAALKSLTDRGVKLGGLRDKTNQRNIAKKAVADKTAEKLRGLLTSMVQSCLTLQEMADSLNASGMKTARGNDYACNTITRLIVRLNIVKSDNRRNQNQC